MNRAGHTNVEVAIWLLRAALAFVFLYAGISALAMPQEWLGFIPTFVPQALAKPSLDLFSVVQIILAGLLIVGVWTRYVAGLSGLIITAITLTNLASLPVTFRDIGLALSAFALMALAKKKQL